MSLADRGFKSMDPQRQRTIAGKGGRAAHAKGTAHKWTREQASEAGKKGAATRALNRRRGADGIVVAQPTLCSVCGLEIAVGQWPCITTIRPHGKSVQTDPFASYFDFALGKEITSLGDRWAAMKPEPDDKFGKGRGQLEYKDKMRPGEISARNDRLNEKKKREEQARG